MSRARCTLKVKGLDCPVEAEALRAALEGCPGVRPRVRPDPRDVDRRLRVDGDRARRPGRAHRDTRGDAGRPRQAAEGRRLLVVAARSMGDDRRIGPRGCSSGCWPPGSAGPGAGASARLAFAVAVAAGGIDLFPRACRAPTVHPRHPRPDGPGGRSGPLALGQWDEAATVAFLFGLSEALEALSLDRARRAVRALLEVAPETAEVVGPDGAIRGRAGRPGPARATASGSGPASGSRSTGRSSSGRSSVDQKAITGESVPVLREPGDAVFAGDGQRRGGAGGRGDGAARRGR